MYHSHPMFSLKSTVKNLIRKDWASLRLGPPKGGIGVMLKKESCKKRGGWGDGRRLDSTSTLGGKSLPAKVTSPKM